MSDFTYKLEGEFVIQYRKNGERVGYLCTLGVWERHWNHLPLERV